MPDFPERFARSVDVLVKAYHDETLVHGSCTACAVGNLISAATQRKHISDDWYWVVAYGKPPTPAVLSDIAATGYSLDELAEIEDAFEGAYQPITGEYDRDGYLGLMAVLDVLMDIDGVHADERPALAARFDKPEPAAAPLDTSRLTHPAP